VISFIVPAYNEERLLGATLSSLASSARALGESYELIVADDASTDGTVEVARAHGATVVPVEFRQIARTRNAGARAARGDPFIFVDADTLVPPATLAATLEALRNGAAGGGARVRFDGRLPLYARVLLPVLDASMRWGRLAAGCYVYCTRAAFERVGGFDERLFATEELAFSRALRRAGRVQILPEMVHTSGRRLRAYGTWKLLRWTVRVLLRGPAALRSREYFGAWYVDRYQDES
jgi:glycosyltransferase involved in cell wall biosynthesis